MDGDNNNNNNDNMDFETKLQEALNKHLEDLNNKIDAIGLENKRLKQEKRSLEVTEELKKRNLDASLYDVVFDNDPEVATMRINIIDEVFKKDVDIRVQDKVMERLKECSYVPGGGISNGFKTNSIEDIIRKG